MQRTYAGGSVPDASRRPCGSVPAKVFVKSKSVLKLFQSVATGGISRVSHVGVGQRRTQPRWPITPWDRPLAPPSVSGDAGTGEYVPQDPRLFLFSRDQISLLSDVVF